MSNSRAKGLRKASKLHVHICLSFSGMCCDWINSRHSGHTSSILVNAWDVSTVLLRKSSDILCCATAVDTENHERHPYFSTHWCLRHSWLGIFCSPVNTTPSQSLSFVNTLYTSKLCTVLLNRLEVSVCWHILTHSDHFYIQHSLNVFANCVLISQAMLILRCHNDLLLH